jgi:hypothetical protein
VTAVRRGASQRSVAASEGVALRTVQRWVERAGDQRLDRVDWADHSSRPLTTRRTPHDIEDVVLEVRERLEAGPLGEHGAEAIGRELEAMALAGLLPGPIPAVRTIGRILERRGVLDGRRRVRRPAPPPGWYLPSVADRTEELDSLDAVVGLTVTGGREVDVLTATSLHGGLGQAWPGWAVTARSTIDALTERWRAHGRPGFAQFDNDTRFHGFPAQDRSLGRVVRFCLSMGVVPVFPPPLETGFQAAIENLNGRWQRALWRREPFTTMEDLRARSAAWQEALAARHAVRIEGAPERRPFPAPWELERAGIARMVYLRRTDEHGRIRLFLRAIEIDRHWLHRLVRVEVDLETAALRCHALRRRHPTEQPLLAERTLDPPPPLTLRYRHPDDTEDDGK